MSIILERVDMPSKNQSIVIEIKPNGRCSMMKIEKGECYELTTKGEAKAIQIPKEHGRLIDADALETVFKDMAKCEWNQKAFPISWAYAFEDTIDEIQDAPTILEAEE